MEGGPVSARGMPIADRDRLASLFEQEERRFVEGHPGSRGSGDRGARPEPARSDRLIYGVWHVRDRTAGWCYPTTGPVDPRCPARARKGS